MNDEDRTTSDFISREELIEELNWLNLPVGNETVDKIFDVIENMPSAHPEVIHCKDCALWHRTGCPMNVFAEKPEPGYFCGTGRRKENE